MMCGLVHTLKPTCPRTRAPVAPRLLRLANIGLTPPEPAGLSHVTPPSELANGTVILPSKSTFIIPLSQSQLTAMWCQKSSILGTMLLKECHPPSLQLLDQRAPGWSKFAIIPLSLICNPSRSCRPHQTFLINMYSARQPRIELLSKHSSSKDVAQNQRDTDFFPVSRHICCMYNT